MEKYIFNPLNDKFPSGSSLLSNEIKYTLKVSKFEKPVCAKFVMHRDGEDTQEFEMTREITDERYVYYSYSTTYKKAGFYWYHFLVTTASGVHKLIRAENLNVIESDADSDFLQLVINKESRVDNAFKKGIIYHIFVDRFCRSGEVKARKGLNLIEDWSTPVDFEFNDKGERTNTNCYGGNLQGVIDKLDYLKSLNVGTIYLSPIFEANSNHKYDVADYSKVDSMFGDTETLQTLIDSAKKIGISIIIDGVFNHTGSDSVYFNKEGRYRTVGAYQNQNSKYYKWYDFRKFPDDYDCWWGIKTLPQTREDSGFFDYIAGKNGIVEKYMAMGLGGFRLDVVDELTNKFLHAICDAARRINNKAYIVGEVWEDASTKISYDERKEYFLGGNLDSVTNYPMKNAILEYIRTGNPDRFVNTVRLILDQYPKAIQNNLMNILDTHDTVRAITYLGANDINQVLGNNKYILNADEKAKGIKYLKLATIMQYTIMGIPTVFYGDEVGIEGTKDPFCRTPYPWGHEDLTLLEWYRELGNLRKYKVFDDGDFKIRYAENSVLIYERSKKDSKVIVAINRGEKDFEFTLTKTMCDYFTKDYLSGKITLKPDEAKVFVM